MSPIYAARIVRTQAEKTWRAVDRDSSSTMEQRTAARKAYEQAKANYRAAFKQNRGQESEMKLQADNVKGVYQVENFDGEVMNQQDFYDALATNPDESVICAEVDAEMAEKIEAEYGIN